LAVVGFPVFRFSGFPVSLFSGFPVSLFSSFPFPLFPNFPIPMPRIILLLVLLLSACNLPQPPAATPTLDSAAVATIAAATLSAIRAQTPAATPTQPPAAAPSPTPGPTASITPSSTANATPNPPAAPLGLSYTFACAYGGGATLTSPGKTRHPTRTATASTATESYWGRSPPTPANTTTACPVIAASSCTAWKPSISPAAHPHR